MKLEKHLGIGLRQLTLSKIVQCDLFTPMAFLGHQMLQHSRFTDLPGANNHNSRVLLCEFRYNALHMSWDIHKSHLIFREKLDYTHILAEIFGFIKSIF